MNMTENHAIVVCAHCRVRCALCNVYPNQRHFNHFKLSIIQKLKNLDTWLSDKEKADETANLPEDKLDGCFYCVCTQICACMPRISSALPNSKNYQSFCRTEHFLMLVRNTVNARYFHPIEVENLHKSPKAKMNRSKV